MPLPPNNQPYKGSSMPSKTQVVITEPLTIHTDGGSRGNPGPAATGIAIIQANGQTLHAFGRYLGIMTNNEAEYIAVVDALDWLTTNLSAPLPPLLFKLDSKLVVEQLAGRWRIKEPRLMVYAQQITHLIQTHHLSVQFTHVLRHLNKNADEQVNIALDNQLNIDASI